VLPQFVDQADDETMPVTALTRAQVPRWRHAQPEPVARWVERIGFTAKAGATALLPGADGRLARVLLGLGERPDLWSYAGLPFGLPEGIYRLDNPGEADAATRAALGWALGGYAFTRYKRTERTAARLVWPEEADRAAVARAAEATTLVRDLVNTPANDLGPAELQAAAEQLAGEFGAEIRAVVGNDLLLYHYPAIHAVGRASARPPRLIDVTWGAAEHPKLTVVGKGVCFDSGGLDIKSAQGMLFMKKDMGGAAHALALARMVMAAGLKVRLRVLIPAVDNAISGDAFRPLDVLATRKGLTVEVGNTDAEGRLILCDALAEADSEKPALLIDFATLTGAARIALGTEIPALFCNHEDTAAALLAAADRESDPLWRLPLWHGYARQLDTPVADLCNATQRPFAGAILAALFLERFVSRETPWAHIDLYAWNAEERPGRPRGGEAMGLRAAFALVSERFGG